MAVEAYDLIKLLHVITAIFLIGVIPFEYLLVARAIRAGDRVWIGQLIAQLEWVEQRVAVPSALLLLASGLAMVYGPTARWPIFDADVLFTTLGLVLWVLLILTFAVFGARAYAKVKEWAKSADPGPAPMPWWQPINVIGAVLALTTVYVMVIKP